MLYSSFNKTDFRINIIGLSSSVPQYMSTFRPRKVLAASKSTDTEIQYDRYKFTSTTFTTDAEGNVNEHIGIEEKTIKIARDWQSHSQGDQPKGGYLAKGLMKFAFQVSRLCFY